MDDRRLLGNRGEHDAEEFLFGLGYKTIERQWRSPFGEIDLICLAPKENEIVFVEVKTRQSLEGGYPEESVTAKKLRHMEAAAECFLRERTWENRPYRFDVIAITEVWPNPPEIQHLVGV